MKNPARKDQLKSVIERELHTVTGENNAARTAAASREAKQKAEALENQRRAKDEALQNRLASLLAVVQITLNVALEHSESFARLLGGKWEARRLDTGELEEMILTPNIGVKTYSHAWFVVTIYVAIMDRKNPTVCLVCDFSQSVGFQVRTPRSMPTLPKELEKLLSELAYPEILARLVVRGLYRD